MQTAWFCIEGEGQEEQDALKFLQDHLGVNLLDTMFDECEGDFWWSFPLELEETKAKTLKWLRKELKSLKNQ